MIQHSGAKAPLWSGWRLLFFSPFFTIWSWDFALELPNFTTSKPWLAIVGLVPLTLHHSCVSPPSVCMRLSTQQCNAAKYGMSCHSRPSLYFILLKLFCLHATFSHFQPSTIITHFVDDQAISHPHLVESKK